MSGITNILSTYCTHAKNGLIIIAFLFFSSCDSFLDEAPDNRVELDNLEKASQLLTNAYSIASPLFTDWMSDDVAYTKGVTIRPSQEQIYLWEDVTAGGPDEQDSPDFYWYETYNSIAHANEVLKVLESLPSVTEDDIAHKNAIRGEALLTRAFAHFELVNIFAKHYNSETSARDLGIPYIKEPETVFIGKYERLSVKKVYNEIEDDLLEGIELIDDTYYNHSGKYHFNKNAALAFASRFYLYKNDMVRSEGYSTELLGSNGSAFIRDITSEKYQLASSSIDSYTQLYNSTEEPANLLLVRKISIVHLPNYGHGPTRNLYDDIFSTNPFPGTEDKRENPALVKGENALYPVRYQFLFQRSSLNSNVGTPYHIAPIFRGEEVLLNRMEANIYLNNIPAFLEDYQILAEKRYSGNPVVTMEGLRAFFGVTNNPSFSDQLVLINILFFERRKEFIAQGMRWFDLKRYEFPVEHDLENGDIIVLTENDLRKAVQLPQSAIDVGGLEPNPR